MIAYKVAGNSVKKVKCPKIAYHLHDSDGEIICVNSHFKTEKEAYEKAIHECEIGIELVKTSIEDIKDQLKVREIKLANECLDLIRLKKEYEKINAK